MSAYTTGEVAKLCGISVRTVQFYDTKDLLHPASLTEGGRRLYSEGDLSRMRLICALKSLGLSLDSIKGILKSERPERVLLLLLDEQERRIEGDLQKIESQKQAIKSVREAVRSGRTLSLESIADLDHMVEEKKKLTWLHAKMLLLAVPMTLIEWGTIILWIVTGVWWPFATGIPLVVLLGIIVTRMYYKNTLYICPECGVRFRPVFRERFWARHNPKTCRLTCTCCGKKSWCVETFGKTEEKGT